jgi:nucleotide-binding universal stress UspA family protein
MKPISHIVVGVDAQGGSTTAVDAAIELAKRFGAALTLVHAYEPPAYAYPGAPFVPTGDFAPWIADAAKQVLDRELAAVRARFPEVKGELRCGPAWQEILDVVEKRGADLVVVGTHGRRGVARALIGSVAEKVVRLSLVPVWVVRSEGERQSQ